MDTLVDPLIIANPLLDEQLIDKPLHDNPFVDDHVISEMITHNLIMQQIDNLNAKLKKDNAHIIEAYSTPNAIPFKIFKILAQSEVHFSDEVKQVLCKFDYINFEDTEIDKFSPTNILLRRSSVQFYATLFRCLSVDTHTLVRYIKQISSVYMSHISMLMQRTATDSYLEAMCAECVVNLNIVHDNTVLLLQHITKCRLKLACVLEQLTRRSMYINCITKEP